MALYYALNNCRRIQQLRRLQPQVLINPVRFVAVLANRNRSVVDDSHRTYQIMVYRHLLEQDYWKSCVAKLISTSEKLDYQEIEDILLNYHTRGFPVDAVNDKVVESLPAYIISLRKRFIQEVPQQIVQACDNYLTSSELRKVESVTSLQFITGWLHHFHPNFIRLSQLSCLGKLLQWRSQETFSSEEEKLSENLVHLAFICGIGKKMYESHEVLNQIATFCDRNIERTYASLSPFDMAIVCESLFKGGIRLESEKSLCVVSSTLCAFLSKTLESESPKSSNSFVIISLLKILRQVDFIDEKLLRLLGELILHPSQTTQVNNIRFITNVVSAFAGPGRKQLHPTPNANSQLSMSQILNHMDSVVVSILHDEESTSIRKSGTEEQKNEGFGSWETPMFVGSRLKDIARWLWTTSTLGYQVQAEIYVKDLSRRLDNGQFTKKPSDAVDALLSLAVMNHYPDALLVKFLRNSEFRSAAKVSCSNRHKGRLGLFLTALSIERNALWIQVPSNDRRQWFDATWTPRYSSTVSEKTAWSSSPRSVKIKSLPGMSPNFKPHALLLNMCLDGFNKIIKSPRASILLDEEMPTRFISGDKGNTPQCLQGYAVPFHFIPGIKLVFPDTRKEIFIEILDDIGLSSSYHNFKMRLMNKSNFLIIKTPREKIENLGTSEVVKLLSSIIAKHR